MAIFSRTINGLNFTVNAIEAMGIFTEGLFRTIEKISPNEIADGYKIQKGFTVFIIVENENGFKVVVPDYTQNPFSDFTEDISLALWVQMEQGDFLRSFSIEGEATRFDDKIVVAKGSLQSEFICMQRYPDLVKNGFSGWGIESIKKNKKGVFEKIPPSGFDSYYAFELLQIRPALIKALGLPYDYVVILDNDEILEILDDQNEGLIERQKGGQDV